MDLNQLYYDHQILLMQAKASVCDELRRLHGGAASTIARRIEAIHRLSGATALRSWETPYVSEDHPAPRRRILTANFGRQVTC